MWQFSCTEDNEGLDCLVYLKCFDDEEHGLNKHNGLHNRLKENQMNMDWIGKLHISNNHLATI